MNRSEVRKERKRKMENMLRQPTDKNPSELPVGAIV